jgi:DNA-binding winged helix-turn-helix (wHTH) protein/tetratricopeptide (TPR) repeat protein
MPADGVDRFTAPFRVGELRIDPGLDRLQRGEESIALEPRAMDLLVFLARRAGETVSKEAILEEVWRGAFVVEGVIPKTVSALRTALGDDAANPRFILTVPRRGYRLVAPVTPLAGAEAPAPVASAMTREAPPSPAPRPGRSRAPALVTVSIVALIGAVAASAWLALRPPQPTATPPPRGPETLPAPVAKLLLEARHLWALRGADAVRRANELLVEAVKEAPRSAELRGWLALSYVTRGNYLGENATTIPRAAEEVARAFALNPDSAIAHCAAGALAINRDLDPATAERHLRRAVALDPDLLAARQYLAEALSILERHDEALAAIDEVLRVEPLSPVYQGVRGLVLTRAGRPLAALEAYDRVLVLDPQFLWAHRNRAWALARLGREEEAAEAFYLEARGFGERPEVLAELRAEIDAHGLAGYWRWKLARLEAVRADGLSVRRMQLAEALAGVGREREALAEIAAAAKGEDGEYFFYFRDSVAFEALRDEPEFRAFYRPPAQAG